jgi:hypothetical protein
VWWRLRHNTGFLRLLAAELGVKAYHAVLAMFVTATAYAQGIPSQTPDALNHWRRSTISLGQLVDDGGKRKYNTISSGIIIALDEHHGCLLTAKHAVYDTIHGYVPTEMRIRLPKDQPSLGPNLGTKVPLVENGRNLWKSLPDDKIDLAAVPLPDLSTYSNVHGVLARDFGTADDIFQGAPITVLGYPIILGEDYLSTPIARGGIIAWTDPTGPAEKRFLIDANMFNGNSSGPVFHVQTGIARNGGLVVGGGMGLIGVVVEDAGERAQIVAGSQPVQALDPATGKTVRAEALVLNIGGIGIVEPIANVRKLIDAHCAD